MFLNYLNVIISTFKIDHGFNMQKLCPQKGIDIPGEAKPWYPVIFTEPLLVYSSQTNSGRGLKIKDCLCDIVTSFWKFGNQWTLLIISVFAFQLSR